MYGLMLEMYGLTLGFRWFLVSYVLRPQVNVSFHNNLRIYDALNSVAIR